MSSSKTSRTVAVGILDFLTKSIANGTVSSEDADSVQVALECVSEVFNVSLDDKKELLGDESLTSIVEKFQSGVSATTSTNKGPGGVSVAAAASSKDGTPISVSVSSSSPSTPSEEDLKEAQKLKVEGNRFMAQQKFEEAVEAYTKAIAKEPRNAVYFSNRSAAYSSLRKSTEAADDARKALEIDPTYSKAYSRLGLALYSLGDAQGAMEAYANGIKSEGDSPSDGMKKGYETAKKRVEEELEASVPGGSSDSTSNSRSVDASSAATASAGGASASAGAGGLPDLSALGNMFGGGGGMPNLSQLMSDPTISQMAQNLMSNPSALAGLMNNPSLQRMRERAQSGQMPNLSELMSDPSLQDMARNFMGGAGSGGNAGSE
ncbi:Sgt2p [Sugiyamaella lignohabitans]|uniref:Sgt2p n=1 Tax=Sugiyamaella lignohabitans TaxID=796027 RepID=A0A167D0A0_9ASCO|nr:Sgt2p [Sugiyamaella lignohabitans]ANB12321.1 Sgt2p [Sugiyamaella lignohabitans]